MCAALQLLHLVGLPSQLPVETIMRLATTLVDGLLYALRDSGKISSSTVLGRRLFLFFFVYLLSEQLYVQRSPATWMICDL